jgi:carbamoyl-phosphate synthase small subunit
VFTYPQIGNYGITQGDSERSNVSARAVVVRELSPFYSPAPNRRSLESFMTDQGLAGLSGVDTRALTRRIRSGGAVIGVIGSLDEPDAYLRDLARIKMYSVGEALVHSVSGRLVEQLDQKFLEENHSPDIQAGANTGQPRLAVVDLGIKNSILEALRREGFGTTIFDVNFNHGDILAGGFDGLVLSNGPGDPAEVSLVIKEIEQLIGKLPMLGICLGHQIIALALGGRTHKMKFGHRGANQPVLCRRSGRVLITSQNHGYAVGDDIAKLKGVEITHLNANDGSVEGFSVPARDVFCVQFHPEASPGPHDAAFIFEQFHHSIEGQRDVTAA